MFNSNPATLNGPDFLDAVADAEEANGNTINAAEFRRRAKQWQQDLSALDAANSGPPSTAVRQVRGSTRARAHAITPTDRRA